MKKSREVHSHTQPQNSQAIFTQLSGAHVQRSNKTDDVQRSKNAITRLLLRLLSGLCFPLCAFSFLGPRWIRECALFSVPCPACPFNAVAELKGELSIPSGEGIVGGFYADVSCKTGPMLAGLEGCGDQRAGRRITREGDGLQGRDHKGRRAMTREGDGLQGGEGEL